MNANNFLNNTIKIFFILLAFASFECNNNPVSTVEASLGTDFDLQYGQTANFPGDNQFSITFKDVEDSRCPIGASCFTAGNANIVLMIHIRGMNPLGDEKIDTLRTDSPEKILGYGVDTYYKFIVKGLIPHPILGKENIKEKYIVTLNVSAGVFPIH